MDSKAHWEAVYGHKADQELSWHQPEPWLSLDLILKVSNGHGGVIDVGGGSSSLVDRLLEFPFEHIAVLDISVAALIAQGIAWEPPPRASSGSKRTSRNLNGSANLMCGTTGQYTTFSPIRWTARSISDWLVARCRSAAIWFSQRSPGAAPNDAAAWRCVPTTPPHWRQKSGSNSR